MTETNLLTDAELEAWSADEPPADFMSRLLGRLDEQNVEADAAVEDDVIPMRLVPEAELATTPHRWQKVAATAFGVAAAAGLVFWLAQPQTISPDEEPGDSHAAAMVAGDGTSGEQSAEPRPVPHEASDSRPAAPTPPRPSTAAPPTPPRVPSGRAPSDATAPRAPLPPPRPNPPPATPASPSTPSAAPPAPPTSPVAPVPPAAAPPAPRAPAPPTPPSAPEAPTPPSAPGAPAPPPMPELPAPSGQSSLPTSSLGLHLRADESTRYRLQCKFGDSVITLVRNGDLDIAMAANDAEEGLLVEGGKLYFRTEDTIACTVRRKKGGRVEAVLRTPRGDTRATLVPPARRIKLRR